VIRGQILTTPFARAYFDQNLPKPGPRSMSSTDIPTQPPAPSKRDFPCHPRRRSRRRKKEEDVKDFVETISRDAITVTSIQLLLLPLLPTTSYYFLLVSYYSPLVHTTSYFKV